MERIHIYVDGKANYKNGAKGGNTMIYKSYASVEGSFDKKYAAAYIAYMMIGSFFKKATFRNDRMKQRLFMNYKAMKEKKQVEWEAWTEALAKETFEGERPEESHCIVSGYEEKGMFVLRFRTGKRDYEEKKKKKGHVNLHRIAAVGRKQKATTAGQRRSPVVYAKTYKKKASAA